MDYYKRKRKIMSKELRALERIRDFMSKNAVHWKQDIAMIETALKNYEMEHALRIRLENINYELVREKEKNQKKLKALEIIREEPMFPVYVKTYKNAFEMVSDRPGFSISKSVEELQKEFNILKEALS